MKLIEICKNIPGKTNLLIALLVILIVWFGLPWININGSIPFETVSSRVIVLIVIAGIYLFKIALELVKKHKEKAFPLAVQKMKFFYKNIGQGLHTAWHWIKDYWLTFKYRLARDKQKRALRRLPWYLVLGAPGSGKKTTIANTGLHFAKPEYFGEDAVNYIKQFPDYEWWFSEQAVLIDALTYDKEQDQSNFKKFIKLLKRERYKRPLNGIILSFCLPDLMLYSNQKRQEFIQEICRTIREIHENFKSLVPMYVIFTKCDQVEGFMEFFNDMSKEELLQVWGISLPLNECNNLHAVQSFFNREFSHLVNQLRKRVLWAFDTERNPRGRELIHSFPQQMQLLKQPIETFILELFSATRHQTALQLRGLYFTSSKQEGQSHDFLLAALSKKFQLVPPTLLRPQRMGECYFARHIFAEVIYPEHNVLGESERSKKRSTILYRSALMFMPLFVIVMGMAMYQGYQDNLVTLKEVNTHLASYHETIDKLNQSNVSLETVLPLLNELNAARNLYNNSPWDMDTLYATHTISSSLNDALMRTLHSLYLPRMAALIESALNQNIANQNLMYATLKGYLAFSASDYSKAAAIKAPMEYAWNTQYLKKPQTEASLKYYLNLALDKPIEKLPLDRHLVNQIRSKLEAIVPANRAYGLLSLDASVNDLTPLLLSTAAGSNFNAVFKAKNPKFTVPALYTRQGYENSFLQQYETIAEEVADDNHDIGLANDSDRTQSSDQIATSMAMRYNQDYIRYWQQTLNNITVMPLSSMNEALNLLNTLTGKQSPLPKILDIVYDNTHSINDGDKVQVDHSFATLNGYSRNLNRNASWQATLTALGNLSTYLHNIESAPNPDKAAFEAAKNIVQGKKNPITDLSIQAANAPVPVNSWLQSIANDCWQLIVVDAHNEMNTAWSHKVMQEYANVIEGRYPLDLNADSQIAIDDFNHFFNNGGTLNAYFNDYIKPFVDTGSGKWRPYAANGHTIQLKDQTIQLFKRFETIRQDYFPNNSPRAQLKLSIMPLTLDTNASSMTLVLGNNNINYSHGPQFVNTLKWPMPFNNEQAQIVINTFDGNEYARSASGPWALFKLLSYANITPTNSTGSFSVDFKLKHYDASFLISGNSNEHLYTLVDLLGLSLPEVIAR